MLTEFVTTVISQVKADFANVELVRAALYASALGTVLMMARQIPARLMQWYRRIAVTTIEVNNNDAAYIWLQKWLSTQAMTRRARRLVVSTSNYQERDSDDYDDNSYRHSETKLNYKPDVGTYFMRYQNYPILVSFGRERIEERNMFAESISLSCLFRRKLLLKLMQEATTFAQQSEKTSIGLFVPSGHYWQSVGERPFRTLESLVYAETLAQTLLADAQKFASERGWYASMGIPWRRGYLLYGPPGNGKTSLAFALASELKFDIYSLNLTGGGLTNDSLFVFI